MFSLVGNKMLRENQLFPLIFTMNDILRAKKPLFNVAVHSI